MGLNELPTIYFKQTFSGLVKQKVNVITQYRETSLAVVCMSYGYLAIIDFLKQKALNHWKHHKGNITSACFVNDYESFATASGSFSKNHDNSIIVSKVSAVKDDLFLKKVGTFSNAHGKYKGVMSLKSTNIKEDFVIVSCGNEDDMTVKVWDTKEQNSIFKCTNPDPVYRRPYYYLNMIFLKPDNLDLRRPSPNLYDFDSDEKMRRGFIIVGASIRGVDFYFKNPQETFLGLEEFITDSDVGSYLNSMITIQHSPSKFTLLVSTISGIVEMFSIREEDVCSISGDGETDESSLLKSHSEDLAIKIKEDVDIMNIIELYRKNELSSLTSEGSSDGFMRSRDLEFMDHSGDGIKPPRIIEIKELDEENVENSKSRNMEILLNNQNLDLSKDEIKNIDSVENQEAPPQVQVRQSNDLEKIPEVSSGRAGESNYFNSPMIDGSRNLSSRDKLTKINSNRRSSFFEEPKVRRLSVEEPVHQSKKPPSINIL